MKQVLESKIKKCISSLSRGLDFDTDSISGPLWSQKNMKQVRGIQEA